APAPRSARRRPGSRRRSPAPPAERGIVARREYGRWGPHPRRARGATGFWGTTQEDGSERQETACRDRRQSDMRAQERGWAAFVWEIAAHDDWRGPVPLTTRPRFSRTGTGFGRPGGGSSARS